jgi:6,7-dimethyl-8-ribityllumazine synthase
MTPRTTSPQPSSGPSGQGLRIAIVAARFNQVVTEKLLDGARQALAKHGVADGDIHVVWVPGAFELPLAAKRLAQTGRYAAIVCLGAVVRGETPHFEYVSAGAVQGIAQAQLETGVPMALGVLTTNDMNQALDRAGGAVGNKGYEAAVTALEMASLLREIGGP